METYLLKSWNIVGEVQLNEGDEFTFDGNYVTFSRGHRYLGFLDAKGEIHAYTDETCSGDITLESTPKVLPGVGSTILNVFGMKEGSNDVQIETTIGTLKMYHPDHCCEVVQLLDICGTPEHLVGEVITLFEVRIGKLGEDRKKISKTNISPKARSRSELKLNQRTYTFYEIQTAKNDVTLRWGEPDYEDNGRYGEEIVVKLVP